MFTFEQLEAAGLPVTRVWVDHFDNSQADFSRELTPAEVSKFQNIEKGLPISLSLSLSTSQNIILADGQDLAVVTFRGEPGATVDYTINGQAQSLTLDESGMDTLELTCDTPNTTLLVQVGSTRVVIFAVEVPA